MIDNEQKIVYRLAPVMWCEKIIEVAFERWPKKTLRVWQQVGTKVILIEKIITLLNVQTSLTLRDGN